MLEERAVDLERSPKILRLVRVAETAPRDEVGARRDRGRGIELKQCQLLDKHPEVFRPVGVEHLRPHRDASRFVACKPAHRYLILRDRTKRNVGTGAGGSTTRSIAMPASIKAFR